MVALLLDTALHCAQAALFESDKCLAQDARASDRGQAEILLPMLGDVMQQAKCGWKDLSEVLVTVGPGVFTGIRTGIAVARALKLALGIPAHGINTLQLLAAMAAEKNKLTLALIDAHKNEIYAQVFEADLGERSPPLLLKNDALASYINESEQVVAYPAAFAKTITVKKIQPVEKLDLSAMFACTRCEPLPLYVRAPDALPQSSAQLRRA